MEALRGWHLISEQMLQEGEHLNIGRNSKALETPLEKSSPSQNKVFHLIGG